MKRPGISLFIMWLAVATSAQGNPSDPGQPKDKTVTIPAAQLLEDIHGADDKKKVAAIENLEHTSPDRLDLKPTAISLLDDKDAKVRRAAVKACRALNAVESAPKLRKLLSSGPRFHFSKTDFGGLPSDVRELHMETAAALVQFKDTDAIDELLSRDEIMGFSGFGGPLMAQYGAQVLPKVLAIARKGDMRKHGTLQTISWMRDEAAVPQLTSLVEDKDREIASAAISALGKIAPKSSAADRKRIDDSLDKAIKSPEPYVRMNAYEAQIRNRDAGEFPLTLEMILKENGLVRLSIFAGLMNSSRKEAIPILRKFIEEDEKRQPNDTNERRAAARAIFRLSGERAPYKGVEQDRQLYPDPYDPMPHPKK